MSSDAFLDKLDTDVKAWKPKDQPTLVGVMVNAEMRQGLDEYEPYPLLTLRDADGVLWQVHCFHTTLRRELASIKPQPGERLGLKYLGKQQGAKREYESYRVTVDRPDAESKPVDWEALGAEEPSTDDKPPF